MLNIRFWLFLLSDGLFRGLVGLVRNISLNILVGMGINLFILGRIS